MIAPPHPTRPVPTNVGKHAVVIGSGFGGLGIAIRLQAAGVQVTLLEKREKIGGRAYQFRDAGYTFDMGPSLITAPGILDSVFQAAGRRLEDHLNLIPLDPFYRIYFHDGTHFDYVGDPDRMREQMRAFNPSDAERYDAFMERVHPIFDAVIGDRLGAEPFDSLGRMAGFVPRMVGLGAHRTVTSFVGKYFEDFRHRFLFSFHPLFVGGNPFRTPSVYLMIPYLEREGGVWFTKGGMYTVVRALGDLFEELGGEIRTEAEVTRICTESGRVVGVETRDGRIDCDLVVSNADVGHTYGILLSDTPRRRWNDKKISKLDYSMSCFLLYIGTRKQYPSLEHHTLILTERYEELLRDIFDEKILPPDFSMYLHVPTRTDPTMAPEGCESMYVLIPVANNRSGIDWERVKGRFTDSVLSFLEEWGMEGLRESMEVLKVFTPNDFETELNAPFGNAFALEPRFSQTAWFRPHNRSEDVKGLYLVGAGTHPGAGVPGVLLSAEATYASVAEDLSLERQPDADEPGTVTIRDRAGSPTMPPGPESGTRSRRGRPSRV